MTLAAAPGGLSLRTGHLTQRAKDAKTLSVLRSHLAPSRLSLIALDRHPFTPFPTRFMATEQVRKEPVASHAPAFGKARLRPSRRPVHHGPARQEARPIGVTVQVSNREWTPMDANGAAQGGILSCGSSLIRVDSRTFVVDLNCHLPGSWPLASSGSRPPHRHCWFALISGPHWPHYSGRDTPARTSFSHPSFRRNRLRPRTRLRGGLGLAAVAARRRAHRIQSG